MVDARSCHLGRLPTGKDRNRAAAPSPQELNGVLAHLLDLDRLARGVLSPGGS
jgi:hypothetical protein